MNPRTPIIAGNWKMHKTVAEAEALVAALSNELCDVAGVDIVVCPPATALAAVVAALRGGRIRVGAQNVHWAENGAFTGEIAPGMLRDLGVAYAIIGHSERRQYFGETDATVNQRLKAALAAGLNPIVCLGETRAEREGDETAAVITRQFENGFAGLTVAQAQGVVIAYEPVWAIGTGLTATPAQAQDVHRLIRSLVGTRFGRETAAMVRIQYGGSVKPDNAAELLEQPDIDGALVGGASLKAGDFAGIVRACL
jgi:triosephosphate isomerase